MVRIFLILVHLQHRGESDSSRKFLRRIMERARSWRGLFNILPPTWFLVWVRGDGVESGLPDSHDAARIAVAEAVSFAVVRDAHAQVKSQVSKAEEANEVHLDRRDSDEVLIRLEALFDGRVGDPMEPDVLAEARKEARSCPCPRADRMRLAAFRTGAIRPVGRMVAPTTCRTRLIRSPSPFTMISCSVISSSTRKATRRSPRVRRTS